MEITLRDTKELINKIMMSRAFKQGTNIAFLVLLALFILSRSTYVGIASVIFLLVSIEFTIKEQIDSLRIELRQKEHPYVRDLEKYNEEDNK
jgi:hypothetical protein